MPRRQAARICRHEWRQGTPGDARHFWFPRFRHFRSPPLLFPALRGGIAFIFVPPPRCFPPGDFLAEMLSPPNFLAEMPFPDNFLFAL